MAERKTGMTYMLAHLTYRMLKFDHDYVD